ncbi:MAG: glycosyltransferase [Rhodospirillaceae bacterium]|jgi:hypothetical protein|nr:glycosyltransferase [Rhodospirillaceae bacterium]MBT5664921.1 glycosyltransferase [Rhodospirillaceae bacterium]
MTQASHRAPFVTFILLSFARPRNLQRIVDTLLKADSCRRVIVSNNQPKIDIRDFLKSADDRVEIIQQDVAWGPVNRYHIARNCPGDFFVSIDDDVFLTPAQIDRLVGELVTDPSRPHGVWGQLLRVDPDKINLFSGVHRINREVDVLNCVYAFTKAQVRRCFELLDLLRLKDLREIGPGDDIFISMSGDQAPFCHDVGPIDLCPSHDQEHVARFCSDNFDARRLRLWRRLQTAASVKPDASVLSKMLLGMVEGSANDEASATFRRHLINLNSIVDTTSGSTGKTFQAEGNLFYHHETTYSLDALPDKTRLHKQSNFIHALRGAATLMEIGFNAGHAALLALTMFPRLIYLGVDNCRHTYTTPCAKYLGDAFGHRFRLMKGNSRDILPLLASQNPDPKPDLIHIDGGHDWETFRQDMIDALRLSDDYTHILIDDTVLPEIQTVFGDFLRSGQIRIPPPPQSWAGTEQALVAPQPYGLSP